MRVRALQAFRVMRTHIDQTPTRGGIRGARIEEIRCAEGDHLEGDRAAYAIAEGLPVVLVEDPPPAPAQRPRKATEKPKES